MLRDVSHNNSEPIVIVEKNLSFTFQPGVHAIKYDDCLFYRDHFVRITPGIKAVDIVCIDDDTLHLIEVKDYRHHRRTKPIGIAEEIALKVLYTLAGIFSAGVNASDDKEWGFATLARSTQRIKIVLHFEQPLKPSKLHPAIIRLPDLLTKLKQRLKAVDPHPKVVCMGRPHTSMRWTVQENQNQL